MDPRLPEGGQIALLADEVMLDVVETQLLAEEGEERPLPLVSDPYIPIDLHLLL